MKLRHALVLHKSSTYHHYTTKVAKAERPAKADIERFKETHDRHYECVETVVAALQRHKIRLTKTERGRLKDYHDFDLIITVGGDGTFLEGARYTRGQLLIGVNSDPKWSVGKLCAATAQTFPTFLEHVLSDAHSVQFLQRLMLRAPQHDYEMHFINDILVAHSSPAGLSRYVVNIDGQAEEQRCSGLWVSTATGSTGAIFSAGGEAMDPESGDFQYLPRELYKGWGSGQDYKLTGGVLSQSSVVTVTSLMDSGMIFVEGSHEKILFPAQSSVSVRHSPYPLHVVRQ